MQTFGSSGGAWSAEIFYDFNLYFWVHIYIGIQNKQYINQKKKKNSTCPQDQADVVKLNK